MTPEMRKSPAGNQGPSEQQTDHQIAASPTDSSLPEKTCARCGELKPLDEFSTRGKRGRHSKCKPCAAELAREYRALNREFYNSQRRERYRANADDERAARRQYHWANIEQARDYYATNRHVYWESSYRQRSERYGFEPVLESFTRDDLIDRYGDACAHCGGPFEQLDHYPVPVALGGAHTLDNCKPACASCNLAQSWSVKQARKAVAA